MIEPRTNIAIVYIFGIKIKIENFIILSQFEILHVLQQEFLRKKVQQSYCYFDRSYH